MLYNCKTTPMLLTFSFNLYAFASIKSPAQFHFHQLK